MKGASSVGQPDRAWCYADAIGDMAMRWSESSAVPVHLETTGHPTALLTDLEVTLYRVAQEALTNVAKHAKASRVGVTVSYMEDVVSLDVRDDGVGFLPGSATPTGGNVKSGSGFGLKAAEQRLRRVGGQLAIESALGAGTAISASVPTIPVEGNV
jgi:signal transduction histidine kinase